MIGLGVNIEPHPLKTRGLMPRDLAIVNATKQYSFVRYALSFVSSVTQIEVKEKKKKKK